MEFFHQTESRRLYRSQLGKNIIITEDMSTFLWAFVGTLSIAGLLGNGFITAVNVHQWLQNKKMLPYGFLLTSLSVSRFLFLVTCLMGCVLYVMCPEIFSNSFAGNVFRFTWIFLNMICLWCATWLSVFYCLKVTNFASTLFMWLKLRTNTLVPRVLGMSVIVFTIVFLPSYVVHYRNQKRCNLTTTLPANASQSQICKISTALYRPMQLTFASVNFCINVSASVILLMSLWKHVKNQNKRAVGTKDISTQVHINVMIPLWVSLLLYIIHFQGMVIYAKDMNAFETNEPLIPMKYLSVFPSIHSIILILTNPKLKEALTCILKKTRNIVMKRQ